MFSCASFDQAVMRANPTRRSWPKRLLIGSVKHELPALRRDCLRKRSRSDQRVWRL